MLDALLSPLSYPFFVTALVCGAAISLCAATLGTHLTLKGFSMLGDGLSHVGFGAAAVAVAVGFAPLSVCVPVVIGAAFVLLRLQKSVRADAAIAMLSAAALAIGVITVNLAGTSFDLNSYLFGSVLAISSADAPWVLAACGIILLLYLLFFPSLFALTHDEDFARATGRRTSLLQTLLATLCAVVVVLGMQTAGALLISSLLIFPPSAAMRLARSFRATVCLSAVLGACSFVVGLYLSYFFSLPAGAAVVCTQGLVYLLCLCLSPLLRQARGRAKKQTGTA